MIEWDEAKRAANWAKHKLDFAHAELVFSGLTLAFEDERDYDEPRFLTIGLLRGIVVVVVHMEEEETEITRIISMRQATKYERELYYEEY